MGTADTLRLVFFAFVTLVPLGGSVHAQERTTQGQAAFVPGQDVVQLHLSPGQVLQAGTCGLAGASVQGSSVLRLLSPSGVLVATSHGACGGVGSLIEHTAQEGGIHTLQARCLGTSRCGGQLAWFVEPTTPRLVPFRTRDDLVLLDVPPGARLRAGTCRLPGASARWGDPTPQLSRDGEVVSTEAEPCGDGGFYMEHTFVEEGRYELGGRCANGFPLCRGTLGFAVEALTPVHEHVRPTDWQPGQFIAEASVSGGVGVEGETGLSLMDLRLTYWPHHRTVFRAGGSLGLTGDHSDGGDALLAGSMYATLGMGMLDYLEAGVGVGWGTFGERIPDNPTQRDMIFLVLRMVVGDPDVAIADVQLHVGETGGREVTPTVTRLEGRLRIYLNRELQAVVRGFAGTEGMALGEAALLWLPGVVGLRASVGFAGLFDQPLCDPEMECATRWVFGPVAGLGLEMNVE